MNEKTTNNRQLMTDNQKIHHSSFIISHSIFISRIIIAFESAGDFSIFCFRSIATLIKPPYRLALTIDQMVIVGVRSLPIVSITSFFTGMVLAFQTAYQINRFGAEIYVGGIVAMSMFRELGPVLTAIVVAGRVGAGMTAELGSMKVTEQIDAMSSMGVDPLNYLVAPRVIATILMLPILTIYADFIGYFGGFVIGVFKVGLNAGQFIDRTVQIVDPRDITTGLMKTFVFGAVVSLVGSFMGFRSKGGASGVGQATTAAVVIASILILIADYFMTSIIYLFE